MTGPNDLHYPERVITFLEGLWGEGFLSPGGADEVLRIVDGVDLSGATVLDIGCGIGGATSVLVTAAHAERVVGIDVEGPVCDIARARLIAQGLDDRVEIRLVQPGALPFDDARFDTVFSKDSIVHIADKESLAVEVFRVLRPGGWFLASDWLTSHDGAMSAQMQAYVAAEDLGFGMASPTRYRRALDLAGFVDVDLVDRNPWYRMVAREELARLTGADRTTFEAAIGVDELATQIRTWEAMIPVLESGEHCPHHIRARRPVG